MTGRPKERPLFEKEERFFFIVLFRRIYVSILLCQYEPVTARSKREDVEGQNHDLSLTDEMMITFREGKEPLGYFYADRSGK